MKWFKHATNASVVIPISKVIEEMGYYAVGVAWTLTERILNFDGSFRKKEACQIFVSRSFTMSAFNKLLSDFDMFVVDEKNGVIHLTDEYFKSLTGGDIPADGNPESNNASQKSTRKLQATREQTASKVHDNCEVSASKVHDNCEQTPSASLYTACVKDKDIDRDKEREEDEDDDADRDPDREDDAPQPPGASAAAHQISEQGKATPVVQRSKNEQPLDFENLTRDVIMLAVTDEIWYDTLCCNHPDISAILKDNWTWFARYYHDNVVLHNYQNKVNTINKLKMNICFMLTIDYIRKDIRERFGLQKQPVQQATGGPVLRLMANGQRYGN